MLDIFLGEALGLFVFVLVHGGILASMALTGKVKEGLAALAVFLGISVGVFAALAGGSPGAHINPAVTMAVFVTGGIDALEALVYIASQIFGGVVGGVAQGDLARKIQTERRPRLPFGHDMARARIAGRRITDRIDRNLRVVFVHLDEVHIAQGLETQLLRGTSGNDLAGDGDFGRTGSVELCVGHERHPQKQKKDERSHLRSVIFWVMTSVRVDKRYRYTPPAIDPAFQFN